MSGATGRASQGRTVSATEFARLVDETAADLRDLNSALEASRILRERDDALRYEQEYGADVYGGPRVLACGCHAEFDCEYHNYVQEFLDAQPSEPVEEDFPCQFEDWSRR